MRVLPYRPNEDEIDGVLVTFVDVTAIVAAEEQQRVLVAELNHRVRNMLQVVLGLANQTLRRSENLESFGAAFLGRIQALARAYELLSHDGWRKVPIVDLIQRQLSPFSLEARRYSLSGPSLVLTANAALSLGLVLYELGTNATKYGAWSAAEGHIEIAWEIAAGADGVRQFLLRWIETGGPAVTAPARKGFGSELMERQLHHEFHGTAAMEFATEGLRVTVTIPSNESLIIEG
jgi:two-component system CheB/CheR fusion protein